MLPTGLFDGYVSSAGKNIIGNHGKLTDGFFLCRNMNLKRNLTVLNEKLSGRVIYATSRPGLDYIALNAAAKRNGAVVVLETYHSGTVKRERENSLGALDVPVYLAGGLNGANAYETMTDLPVNVTAVNNITGAALYYKALLSIDMNETDRKSYLSENTAGEFF